MKKKTPLPTITFAQWVSVIVRIDEPGKYLVTRDAKGRPELVAYTREADARKTLDALRLNDWCQIGHGNLQQLLIERDGGGFRYAGCRLDQPITEFIDHVHLPTPSKKDIAEDVERFLQEDR